MPFVDTAILYFVSEGCFGDSGLLGGRRKAGDCDGVIWRCSIWVCW